METETKKQVQILVEKAQQLYGDLKFLQKEIPLAEAAVKQDPDLSVGPELLRQMQDIRDELGGLPPKDGGGDRPPECIWCTGTPGVSGG